MNYLFYLKAGEWAKSNGFDEAVILNADGSVSETNTGNIIIVEDKT
ncbi:MAG: aminotransferase class IV, partial [Spirochaetaceae bacterium]|nr:aminotransferase class IV [Spirochaetaceae bacterium]